MKILAGLMCLLGRGWKSFKNITLQHSSRSQNWNDAPIIIITESQFNPQRWCLLSSGVQSCPLKECQFLSHRTCPETSGFHLNVHWPGYVFATASWVTTPVSAHPNAASTYGLGTWPDRSNNQSPQILKRLGLRCKFWICFKELFSIKDVKIR